MSRRHCSSLRAKDRGDPPQRARDANISTDAIWSSWPWLLGSVCQYRALASSQRPSAMVGVGTRGRYERLLLTLSPSASEHPCDAEAIKDARAPSRRHRRPDHPSIDGIKLALDGDGSQQGEGRA